MEKQVLSQGAIWYSYGLVLLIMVAAVATAAIRDTRLAKRLHDGAGKSESSA